MRTEFEKLADRSLRRVKVFNRKKVFTLDDFKSISYQKAELIKDRDTKPGIYLLIINDKNYIGSSKNLYRRIKHHESYLKLNKHHNKDLQGAFNKFKKLSFQILEHTDNLREKEQYWINEYDAIKLGYNKVTASSISIIDYEIEYRNINTDQLVYIFSSLNTFAKRIKISSRFKESISDKISNKFNDKIIIDDRYYILIKY